MDVGKSELMTTLKPTPHVNWMDRKSTTEMTSSTWDQVWRGAGMTSSAWVGLGVVWSRNDFQYMGRIRCGMAQEWLLVHGIRCGVDQEFNSIQFIQTTNVVMTWQDFFLRQWYTKMEINTQEVKKKLVDNVYLQSSTFNNIWVIRICTLRKYWIIYDSNAYIYKEYSTKSTHVNARDL